LADVLAARWRLSPFRRAPRALAADGHVGDWPVTLLKPQTYMNLTGEAIEPLLAHPDFDAGHHLLLLVDDAALPLGTFRLRARGSSGGHHGLESVEQVLGSRGYARLRIGIGPVPADVEDLADFVLAPFTRAEAATLGDLLPAMAEAVECWVAEGIQPAMNRFNKKTGGPARDVENDDQTA
jgi:PTH1 family peptidyl-tRNA hydrolase